MRASVVNAANVCLPACMKGSRSKCSVVAIADVVQYVLRHLMHAHTQQAHR